MRGKKLCEHLLAINFGLNFCPAVEAGVFTVVFDWTFFEVLSCFELSVTVLSIVEVSVVRVSVISPSEVSAFVSFFCEAEVVFGENNGIIITNATLNS